MKKIFTLFAAALLGLCANAEVSQYGPCPSKIKFAMLEESSTVNKVEIEVQLVNSSLNLNGFNLKVEKAEGSESVVFRKSGGSNFSAAGYASTILKRWETTMGEDEETGDEVEIPVTDEMREEKLLSMCDVQSNVNPEGKLVIIEILKTNECRFFPVLEEPTGIGKFFLNMSNCEDGEYTIVAPDTPQGNSMSYTGGDEPLSSWTADEPVSITLKKTGDKIEVVTGISTIVTDEKPVDNRIFDLQGRELQSVPEHGIYIQNGKKYVK